jgi:hypothetical protein
MTLKKMFPSRKLLHPLLAAATALGLSVTAFAQPPGPPPPPSGNHLPGFIKVDSVYVLDGNDDDLVRVLELSNTSWIKVRTKSGESWVNVDNLTTITPVSKEAADRSEMKQKADFILAGAEAISVAIDDYASKQNLPADAPVKWTDIRKYMKPGTPIYESEGKDVTGRPYLIGPTVADHVRVSPDTLKELQPAIDDTEAYWGKFKS